MGCSILAEVLAHKPPVEAAESGDAVGNVAPEVEVIALLDDPAVVAESELRAAVDRRAGPPSELHLHLPLQEDVTALHHDRTDVHIDLLAAPGEPVAQSDESVDAFDALDAVLKDDVLVVVGEDVRPVGLACAVVGF